MDSENKRRSGLMPPWQPGESGNPAGRPKGARNRLSERFLRELYDHWQQHGREVIDRLCEERPGEYLEIVAHVVERPARNQFSQMAGAQ